MRTISSIVIAAAFVLPIHLASCQTPGPVPNALNMERLSSEAVPDGDTLYPPVSYDGLVIAFSSKATNLVANTNGVGNVFIADRVNQTVRRVSVAFDGTQTDGESTYPSISGTGLQVAYTSRASNLVPGDTNGVADAFVFDVPTGSTTRETVSTTGEQANGESYTYFPAVSADGRFIVFSSKASNLVPDDTNGTWDVFLRDRFLRVTRRVSVSTAGEQANGPSLHAVISGNGRYVAFHSLASNLVPGYGSGAANVFVHDLETGQTKLVSRGGNGTVANGKSERSSISHDGRFIAFSSEASNLIDGDNNGIEDVFVHDQLLNTIVRVSVGQNGEEPIGVTPQRMDRKSVISPDGRYVLFRSDSPNLVRGDTNGEVDIFLHDRLLRTTERVSVDTDGKERRGLSEHHAISWDARVITFSSERFSRSDPQVAGLGRPPLSDVYVYERNTKKIKRFP